MSLKDRVRVGLWAVLLTAVFAAACQPTGAINSSANPSPTVQLLTNTPAPEQLAARQAWQNSPHADTYDLEKGPNTYCAQCHSPGNWDPAATIDPPPNCVSCKFPSEPDPRLAQGNLLVPEEEWADIGCETCHPADNGEVTPEIAWLNPVTGYHETVKTPTDLCEKCHTDTKTIRHRRDLGDDAHADYDCTECHDPHSTEADCLGCHEEAFAADVAIPGHDEAHTAVTCTACHDGANLEVGPAAGEDTWVTFRTTQLLGRSNTVRYQSHNVQREVKCDRCHYPDNPWGLTTSVTP